MCFISVLRWLYSSWEGWGRVRGPPTEEVCSDSFFRKKHHYVFYHLNFSQPTEKKSNF